MPSTILSSNPSRAGPGQATHDRAMGGRMQFGSGVYRWMSLIWQRGRLQGAYPHPTMSAVPRGHDRSICGWRLLAPAPLQRVLHHRRMGSASEHLRGVAARIVQETRERVPLRAALLTGSAGRGDADYYSDIDLLCYVDQIPTHQVGAALREAVGGTKGLRRALTEDFSSEEFDVKGIRVELSFTTMRSMETRLDDLLERLVDIDTPSQKILSGVQEGLPLHGRELIDGWKTRIAHYPEPMRRAMVQRYWKFFPLWYGSAAMVKRDAELWRLDMLLEAAFNLVGVLAGLNRLYFTRFQFKGARAYVARMNLAPVRFANRLESLFDLNPEAAAAELERLVEETQALVEAELPGFDVGMRFPPGTRQQPWSQAD